MYDIGLKGFENYAMPFQQLEKHTKHKHLELSKQQMGGFTTASLLSTQLANTQFDKVVDSIEHHKKRLRKSPRRTRKESNNKKK